MVTNSAPSPLLIFLGWKWKSNFLQITSLSKLLCEALTHYRPVTPSYRSQSIDLQSKSLDWFLYETFFAEILLPFGQKQYNSRTFNLIYSFPYSHMNYLYCNENQIRFFITTLQLTLKKPFQVSIKIFRHRKVAWNIFIVLYLA